MATAGGATDRVVGGTVGRAHDRVRTHLLGEVEAVRVAVDGDDARSALDPRHRDRRAPDRTAAEDDDGPSVEIAVRAGVHRVAERLHGCGHVGRDARRRPARRWPRGRRGGSRRRRRRRHRGSGCSRRRGSRRGGIRRSDRRRCATRRRRGCRSAGRRRPRPRRRPHRRPRGRRRAADARAPPPRGSSRRDGRRCRRPRSRRLGAAPGRRAGSGIGTSPITKPGAGALA